MYRIFTQACAVCILAYVFYLPQGNPRMRVAASSEAIVIGRETNSTNTVMPMVHVYLTGG